jgi:hypothetical protein
LKDIQQLPAILQHSKTIFTLYIQALLTFSGTTNYPSIHNRERSTGL